MAVARMLKLQIIAHKSLKNSLIHALQENGLVQITSIEKPQKQKSIVNTEEKINLEEKLASIKSALDFINTNNKKKQGFISSMIPPKIDVKKQSFFNIEKKFDIEKTLNRLSELEISLQETNFKLDELNKLKKELTPWKEFKITPSIKFNNVSVITGSILTSKEQQFSDTLSKEIKFSEIVRVSELQGKSYIAILCNKEYETKVKNILINQSFQNIVIPVTTTCKKAYQDTVEQLSNLNKDLKTITEEIKSFVKIKDDLTITEALTENKLNKLYIQENFIKTSNTIFINGWVPVKSKDKVISILDNVGDEIDYFFLEPTEEDNPPIILDNPSWLKPLESVTTLYGYPGYFEKDPTPYMAPFFLLFFGLSIGDVGYGLVIAFAAWVLMKKMKISKNSKQFLKLFIYGGFASIPVGILTGSWFAVDLKHLPVFIQKMAITDPMKNPMPFLIFCLGLGFIHLFWGVTIELLDGLKDNINHSLMDNLPILLFLPAFAALIVLAFFSASGVTPTWSPFAKWFALLSAASVILFTNRTGKNIFSKLGGGLYNLYGMSSFIGDTISYARLMALGLATFLIGQAINLMATLFFSMFGLIFGIIVATVILVVGHVFNIVINLISAFVHPARLQYVEFFTKFFEGGGRSFQPFKIESKNLNIEQ